VAVKLDESSVLQPVPLASVERIEVSRGFVRGNTALTLAGAGIGTGVGIAVAVDALSEDCVGDLCELNQLAVLAIAAHGHRNIRGLPRLVGVPFFKHERWRKVPLDRLRVSFAPQPDGRFGFWASTTF
jgi:hypothetical protein